MEIKKNVKFAAVKTIHQFFWKALLLKSFCFLFLALAPAVMYAEEESDSTFTHELQEVVIEAPKIIHKSDMDVYYPSKSALDHSQSGVFSGATKIDFNKRVMR